MIALVLAATLGASYEMADLKALESQQGWRELVDHLGDVLPSKRDAEWKGLAERALVAFLDTLELKDAGKAQRSLDEIDAQLKRWAWLKQSKPFMAKRAEVGLKAFGVTFSASRHSSGEDPWRDALREFVAADALTADLPLRAGKLITSRLVAEIAIPYFKAALAKDKALCKDAEVQKALLSAWESGSFKDDATAMTDACWAELQAPVVGLLKTANYASRKNVLCPYLAGKKAVPAEQKAQCTFE